MQRTSRTSRSARAGRERVVSFGEFELDLAQRELRCAGAPLGIAPKPLELLCYLVANRDRAVSKREVLEQVWPDSPVGESALSSALRDLRRTLGEDGQRPAVVRTYRRRGYRFAARVAPAGADARGRPLLQRERELRALGACLEGAAHGVPCVALVTGPPGCGKTRLVEELLRGARASAFALGSGRCRADVALPYHPFAQALATRLASAPEDVAPQVHSSARPCEGNPAALAAAVWRALVRAARARPTLLLLEDLHHADSASLALLERLARRSGEARAEGGVPLCVIATARPVSGDRRRAARLARLAGLRCVVALELAPLDAPGAHQAPGAALRA